MYTVSDKMLLIYYSVVISGIESARIYLGNDHEVVARNVRKARLIEYFLARRGYISDMLADLVAVSEDLAENHIPVKKIEAVVEYTQFARLFC